METNDSEFLRKEPCPKCGSRDNLARYTDGHGYCFGCGHYEHANGETPTERPKQKMSSDFLHGHVKALSSRKITEETCRKFGYTVAQTHDGKNVQVAPYYSESGELVAQKVRTQSKDFYVTGSLKEATLFGQRLWGKGSSKKIVVCEGEIDCMTVSQVRGNKWATVSIPNGANGARKALAANLEYLESFEEIVLMFDMDEPGQAAAQECAPLFSPGKCKIASLSMKDPNELLKAGMADEIVRAVFEAKEYRPDGIVTVADLIDELNKPVQEGFPWFVDSLTKLTFGRRECELYGFGAGTGIGKTDFLTQQIAYDINVLNQRVGAIFLEQQPTETIKRVAGKVKGKRFHVPGDHWTPEELVEEASKLDHRLYLYASFGETDWAVVKNKIRFMAVSQGIKLFYVDHLTAMADTSDEKGSLEQIMKEMAGIANELKIIIHFVSHLATPEGKPHEEGGHVSIRHFKGSRAIGFWSYFMFGLERNQQDPDLIVRSTTTFRVLKDRYTGQATGNLLYFGYEPETGRLFETKKPEPKSEFKDESNAQTDF